LSATQPTARGVAASPAGLRSAGRARQGLEGMAAPADRETGPAAPAPVPVPLGAGSGNGGDGATGGGAGGFSGAAELYSQALGYVPSPTLALQASTQSHAPEPFLLLLERPG
jgi:hypothetical protein